VVLPITMSCSGLKMPQLFPEESSNLELHRLVTKYQMHKCSDYCKRKINFVTRCKFGFPRQEVDEDKLNAVEDCLKRRNKIFQICFSRQTWSIFIKIDTMNFSEICIHVCYDKYLYRMCTALIQVL